MVYLKRLVANGDDRLLQSYTYFYQRHGADGLHHLVSDMLVLAQEEAREGDFVIIVPTVT